MIEFRTLGMLTLGEVGGRELHSLLAQPKRIAVLAYLCVARPHGFHRRDTLLGLFWPEADAEHARASLRKAVHMLRRALGEAAVITRGDEDVAIDAARVWCDAAEFDAAHASAHPAEALELYAGELLPGFFVEGAPGFERWLESERARLRGCAADAAWASVEEHESAGDFKSAVVVARRAVELGGSDEPGTRRLVELMDRTGDRAGALRLHDEFTRRLAAEYDVMPSEKTQALGESLRVAASVHLDASRRPVETTNVRLQVERVVYSATGADAMRTDAASIVQPVQAIVSELPRLSRTRMVLRTLAAVIVCGGLAVAVNRTREGIPPLDPNLLLVAPLAVMDSDLGIWRDGIPELLARGLDDARPLRALPASLVLSRRADDAGSLQPRDLALRSGAGLVLVGSLLHAGKDTLRVTASIVDVASNRNIVELDVRESASRMDRLIDSLSLHALRGLSALHTINRYDHGLVGSANLGALKFYLTALQFARAGDHDSATTYIERSIALDSGFAQAWRLRGDIYWWCCDVTAVVKESFFHAASLNHGLPRSDSVQIVADSIFAAIPWQGVPSRRRALGARLFTMLEREVRFAPIEAPWWALGEARFHYWRLHSKSDTVGFASAAFLAGGMSSTPPGGAPLHTLHEAMQRLDTSRVRSMIGTARDEAQRRGRPMPAYMNAAAALVRGEQVDTNRLMAVARSSSAWEGGMINMLVATWPDRDEAGVEFLRRESQRVAAEGGVDSSDSQRWLAMALASRGHLRELLANHIEDELVAAAAAHVAVLYGMALPDTLMRPYGDWADASWSRIWISMPMWSAMHDTSSIAAAINRARVRSVHDSGGPNAFSSDAVEYDGPAYLTLARGDTASAIRAFDAVPDGACERGCEFAGLIHARLLANTRPRDALTILRSVRGVMYLRPYYAIERARIAERLNLIDEARTAYRSVLVFLRTPDFELMPLVSESNAALRRLDH